MKTKYILLLSLLLIFVGCSRVKKNEFRISGSLDGGNNKFLYFMEMTPEGFKALDTIALSESGDFSFRSKYTEPKIYILQINDNNYITLIPSPKEDIKLRGHFNAFSASYAVENSPESELLHRLNKEYIHTNEVLRELEQTLFDHKYSDDFEEVREEVYDMYKILQLRQTEMIRGFLKENPGSLSSIIALYRKFDNHYLFSLKTDLDVYEEVYEELNKTMPNNPHTLGLKSLIDRAKRMNEKERMKNASQE